MKAIYAGSFDPPTLGHAWIIEQAARMFDELTVTIGVNPDKKCTYDIELRQAWLAEISGNPSDIAGLTKVDSFEGLFLVDYAQSIGADVIVRGIRNPTDFTSEYAMRHINSDLQRRAQGITAPNFPEILTVFLMPPRELAEISSSVVKGMIGPAGWKDAIRRYLPLCVYHSIVGYMYETKKV